MKRNLSLIHDILKLVEEHATGMPYAPKVEGFAPEVVKYHVGLCVEAGFLHQEGHDRFVVNNLTWAGHNALDKLNAGCEMRDIADCSV